MVVFPRAKGAGGVRHAPPQWRLVSFRQCSSNEGNAYAAKNNATQSPDEQFLQLSLEEGEGDGTVSGISESVLQDVKKSAIELLAIRAYTVSELRKKLCGKNYSVDTVDSVIADFKSRGLLNDGYYAESFSRSRWQSSTWGPRRIKQALRQKGVPEAEVDQATRSVFQDVQGDEEQTTHGFSKASMDHLFAQASKQWQRGGSLPLEKRRARIVRWLQYRGFNWAVTNSIIRKLEAQHPP
ncbi:regulatory protein RecX-like [Lolium rigidum]|uniref:regulatory protein RecX-like n=1 Tax=Lolium rigidum TaxID=89674 RepID=UPI001F5D6824|nr:regulatory protein RecX-like [Lolium rigidum]